MTTTIEIDHHCERMLTYPCIRSVHKQYDGTLLYCYEWHNDYAHLRYGDKIICTDGDWSYETIRHIRL